MSLLDSVAPRLSAVPFGRVAPRVQESGRPDMTPLSVFLDDGVVPRSSREDNHNRLGEDLSKYLAVEPGDIVFNKLRTWQGGLGVSAHQGIVSPAYFVCRPVAGYVPRFLHYLLRSTPYRQELARISKWMPPSQFDIGWEQLRLLPVLAPCLDEQRAIADYLDAETARIDAIIDRRRRMLDLLTARYRRIISDHTAIGRPVQVRRVVSLCTSGPRGWSEMVAASGSTFIRSANLTRDGIELRTDNLVKVDVPHTAESLRSCTAEDDVLVGITGANAGWAGLVRPAHAGGYVSQHVAMLRPRDVIPKWLAYSIFSHRSQEQLLGSQYGGTKTQLGLADLNNLEISLPERLEQSRLVEDIELAGRQTATAKEVLARQIALLTERRQALITAAVTGELSLG